jgi:hypothetical protein
MPLVEALVGSSTSDLYDAIFDMDLASEFDPFDHEDDEDRDVPVLRSIHSRENLSVNADLKSRHETPSPTRSRRQKSPVGPSPRSRTISGLLPLELGGVQLASGEHTSGSLRSPLARLYATRVPVVEERATMSAEGAMRRMEVLLEDMRDLPVQKLKDEMKELQVCVFYSSLGEVLIIIKLRTSKLGLRISCLCSLRGMRVTFK